MPPISVRLGARAPRTLLLAAAALAMIGTPLAASAQTSRHHHHMAGAPESVEQRITTLHDQLMITPDEEAGWSTVAATMRQNDMSMRRLMDERKDQSGHELSAVEDLRTYERFAQAHVTGLKTLIDSFETLYHTMPDAQKVVADGVFRKFSARRA